MRPTLVLHGGAGRMPSMDPERALRYREAMRQACAVGAEVLRGGGSALDATVAATVFMEDGGVFNAGLGSCLTSDGTVEMDAAVMEGWDGDIGAVAGVAGVANPILLARAVMERSPHCMLGGAGAAAFAEKVGLPLREGFPSAARLADWRRRKSLVEDGSAGDSLDQRIAALGGVLGEGADEEPHEPVGSSDTVGAVAIDEAGHLAAACSTGGIWMKMVGRIGDSPLPGAGLWAVDGLGAAVATGTGEKIMRALLCREVVDRMAGAGAQAACEAGVGLLTERFGSGVGGVVAVGPDGEPAFAFNTRGMGRAVWRAGQGEAAVAIWPGEAWDREGGR